MRRYLLAILLCLLGTACHAPDGQPDRQPTATQRLRATCEQAYRDADLTAFADHVRYAPEADLLDLCATHAQEAP